MRANKGWIFGGFAAALLLFAGGCFCGAPPVSGKAEASLYVTDTATGTAVRGAVFTERGTVVNVRCMEVDSQDPSLCTSSVLLLSQGSVHPIQIEASGYKTVTVDVDMASSPSVHLAVELTALTE